MDNFAFDPESLSRPPPKAKGMETRCISRGMYNITSSIDVEDKLKRKDMRNAGWITLDPTPSLRVVCLHVHLGESE